MFRANVAALIRVGEQYLACSRADYQTWQCVQGGIETSDDSPRGAVIRELYEELGILPKDFSIMYQSKFWRRYFFTKQILAKKKSEKNIGQEQLWFLIDLKSLDCIHLEKALGEFDKVSLVSIHELLKLYSPWKKSSFYDFCREMSLI
jgi:putative (di)nucleoside polyphosphate hydrolase